MKLQFRKRHSVLAIFVTVIALFVELGTRAEIVSVDDPVFGIGSITRDTVSGLEWLDLNLTTNKSVSEITSQLGSGGQFQGFRYATSAEVFDFFSHAGIPLIETRPFTVTGSPANIPTVPDLMAVWGITGSALLWPGSTLTHGFIADRPTPEVPVFYISELAYIPSIVLAYASPLATSGGTLSTFPEVGHALVRASGGPPADRDGDGVADSEDQCPDEPGLPAFNGCPDTDGDGIPDHLDACPSTPGDAAHNGCPIPPPQITCPQPKVVKGCNSSIGNLSYSAVPVTISLQQLKTEGGDASGECGIANISYVDTKSGDCPEYTIQRLFVVTDNCGGSARCEQRIDIVRQNLIGTTPYDLAVVNLQYTPIFSGTSRGRWDLTARAFLKNFGPGSSRANQLRFELIDSHGKKAEKGSAFLSTIAALETRQVDLTWLIIEPGTYSLRVTISEEKADTNLANDVREILVVLP